MQRRSLDNVSSAIAWKEEKEKHVVVWIQDITRDKTRKAVTTSTSQRETCWPLSPAVTHNQAMSIIVLHVAVRA